MNSDNSKMQASNMVGGDGVVAFSGYGATTSITTPSAAESIDGSALGL